MTDTTLLETTLERTLDAWLDRFARTEWRGATVEGWLFEGASARRAAERRLRAAGVQANLRSAYKPLVHYFLEEVDRDQLATVTVRYPVHPLASPRRFVLEAYPLAGLLADCAIEFLPGDENLHYQLALTFKDGGQRQASVWAPNRSHRGCSGATLLSPTGWLRVRSAGATAIALDAAETTDYERVLERIAGTVEGHAWPAQEPYFERLDIRVDLPGMEQPLPVGHECISSHEALHEDIYFSLLEIFQRRSGRAAGDRRLQPGQIVPDVRASDSAPRLRIAVSAFKRGPGPGGNPDPAGDAAPLEQLETAPTASRVASEMALLRGHRFGASSRQGRAVRGVYQRGSGPAVYISGGQHANETSGVVGALRAARTLAQQADSHFALVPLENPDGYALQRELAARNPRHMLHAARYSALGDDIEYREQPPLYERAAREQALALSGAQLHVNLHGYPAHEWTRPLSGYLPHGFELWTIPKGFFLILRHHSGWQAEGRALVEQVAAALAQVPGLADYNARQLALYQRHAGALPFEVIQGTACAVSQVDRPGAPVTLITEYPDETIAGQAFQFAHTVQMEAALAAVRAWQTLARR
ncbi:MAG TPA: M14 family zinc carboxypeptidase [Ramlibacter sp.]|nr:M14 family zinc carboxypeptidase [Ramlibacter sp.]